jgi:zinc transport system permease protein
MSELLTSHFVQNFLLGGSLLATLCGILGCFLLWRRMAFFSDTLAHCSLLGVALGLWLHINLLIGVLLICMIVAFTLGFFSHQFRQLPIDTWLSLISYTGLAGGMIALAKLPGIKADPQTFLFGDPLSLTTHDIFIIGFCLIGTVLYLSWNWRTLLLVMLDTEMAMVSGIAVKRLQLFFILLLALVVTIGLKTIGALLLPALMIFPAATYGLWARSPETMVLGASSIAVISLWLGSLVSFHQDWPTGPSIICAAFMVFFLSFMMRNITKSS